MKKTLLILTILTCCGPAWTQYYFTPTLGYGFAMLRSDDLKLFKDTYNSVNVQRGLVTIMQGLEQPVGLRAEAGYRYFGRLTHFASIGYQSFKSKDVAQFDNLEGREWILKVNSFFIEGGVGRTFDRLFVNGLVAVHVFRKVSLESRYFGPSQAGAPSRPLDGFFEGSSTISFDLGAGFGLYRDPMIVFARITYPLFTGGNADVLTDNSPAKIADGSSVYPDDYISSLFEEPYKGIESNLDGFKIYVTIAFAFKIRD